MTTTVSQPRPTLNDRTGKAHARLWGIGGYRPERVVTNDEICERIDSTDEWIRDGTGVIPRRFTATDETVFDMAAAATGPALKAAGIADDSADMRLGRDVESFSRVAPIRSANEAAQLMLASGQAPHGRLALQIGFGAGLSTLRRFIVLP